MSITLSRIGSSKVFHDPQSVRNAMKDMPCDVGAVNNNDGGDYEFATINFGSIRFSPIKLWNMELERVNGWEFVAMAGYTAIYCKKKESVKK